MTKAEFIKREKSNGWSDAEIKTFLEELEEDFKKEIAAGKFDYDPFSLGLKIEY